MKRLRSKKMRALLSKAIIKARKMRVPNEGYMESVLTETCDNGWHYQAEFIRDSRIRPKPYVVVYAFAPYTIGRASHYLTQGD